MPLLAWLGGCAPRSLPLQQFVEITTTHFAITSSWSPDRTRELAVELERFHAGVELVFGATTGAEMPRAQVLAFDDRSLGRPFAIHDSSSYLVPGIDRPLLVLRTPDAWERASSRDLRHEYVHELRRRDGLGFDPLWYEEGVAHFASTVAWQGEMRFHVGAPIHAFVTILRDGALRSALRTLGTLDLSDASPAVRGKFEANAWALVHYLATEDVRTGGERLSVYRAGLASPAGPIRPEMEGGTFSPLAKAVRRHVKEKRYAEVELRRATPVESLEAASVEALPPGEAQFRLARLALAIDRPVLAAQYFEIARSRDPLNPRALSGLALCSANEGNWTGAFDALGHAIAISDGRDAGVELDAGEVWLLLAEQVGDDRAASLRSARAYLTRSATLAPEAAAPRVALARSYLLPGEDVARGLDWAEDARTRAPGLLEVQLLEAQLKQHAGASGEAEALARQVLSRTHWGPTRDAARSRVASSASSVAPPGERP